MNLTKQFPAEEGFYWILWYPPVEYGHHEFKAPEKPEYEVMRVVKSWKGHLMLLRCGSGFEWQDEINKFGEAQFSEKLNDLSIVIDMILFCPACQRQHIDREESEEQFKTRNMLHFQPQIGKLPDPIERWTNPPHRSHKCEHCGFVWRPADVPTNGVATILTKGKNDSE